MAVWVQENRWDDQLNYHSGPDPGLRVGPPQYLLLQFQSYRISMTQGSNIGERFWDKPSVDSVAEARGLQPEQ